MAATRTKSKRSSAQRQNLDPLTYKRWYEFGYIAGGQERDAKDVGLQEQSALSRFNFMWDRAVDNGQSKQKDHSTMFRSFTKGFRDGYNRARRSAKKNTASGYDDLDVKREADKRARELSQRSGATLAAVRKMAAHSVESEYDIAVQAGYVPPGQKSAWLTGWRKGFGARRNPEDAAATMFEKFHGEPSDSIIEFVEESHYHGNLAACGILLGLKVRTPDGSDITIGFTGGTAANPSQMSLALDQLFPGRKYVLAGKFKTEREGQELLGEIESLGARGRLDRVGRIPPYKWETYVYREDAASVLAALKKRKRNAGPVAAATKLLGSASGYFTDRGPIADVYRTGAKYGKRIDDKVGKVLRGKNPAKGWQVWSTEGSIGGVGVPVNLLFNGHVFPSKKAAMDYWYDTIPGRNERATAIRVGTKDELISNLLDRREGRRNPEGTYGPVILCVNEDGTQLYLQGGDQSLDLKQLKIPEKDSVVIGEAWLISYRTRKSFDDFQDIDYVHGFGDEKAHPKLRKSDDLWEDAKPPEKLFGTGKLPTVRYDALNQRIHLDGGVYVIKKPVFGVSPGIEN